MTKLTYPRYCLTYEEWLDIALGDPEGYGYTLEEVQQMHKEFLEGKTNGTNT